MQNEVQPKYLPQNLRGKIAGQLSMGETAFDQDLDILQCKTVSCANPVDTLAWVDFFVLDCRPFLGAGYAEAVRSILRRYRERCQGRFCYAVIPASNLNYNWDVVNSGIPVPESPSQPGARWTYDELLRDFSARALGGFEHSDKIRCVVTRLLPLKRTVLCIMASSGQGKTTLVRQLANKHSVYHVSSDYTLSYLIDLKADPIDPDTAALRQAIQKIDPTEVWGRFFRLLEEDRSLLKSFLSVILHNLEMSEQSDLVSFDIDIRTEESRAYVRKFFQDNDLKVWSCTT